MFAHVLKLCKTQVFIIIIKLLISLAYRFFNYIHFYHSIDFTLISYKVTQNISSIFPSSEANKITKKLL